MSHAKPSVYTQEGYGCLGYVKIKRTFIYFIDVYLTDFVDIYCQFLQAFNCHYSLKKILSRVEDLIIFVYKRHTCLNLGNKMLLKNEYASPLTTDKNVLNENATKLKTN